MECGAWYVTVMKIGDLVMLGLYIGNLDSQLKVKSSLSLIMLIILILLKYLSLDAYILDYEKRFGSSENYAVIGDIHCVGTETELLECSHSSVGNHQCWFYDEEHPEIIVSCYGMLIIHWLLFPTKCIYLYTDGKTNCVSGDVKLKDGAAGKFGYVEVCYDRRWVEVCKDGWDADKTRAVCNQLNFDPEGMI